MAAACIECRGSRKIRVDSSSECDSCNGEGIEEVMCTSCNEGYIERDCHEIDPHKWTLYKCSYCDDFSFDGREDDEVAAKALYQHEYKHED